MTLTPQLEALRERKAPLAMASGQFRDIGHRLVEQMADRLAAVPAGPVTLDEPPASVRRAFGADLPLPHEGADPAALIRDATDLLFEHSLFNGHPRFFGYITSSPAPIGMFGDFLAAALNQNVGAWNLAPLATEIEGQTVRWLAELIGFPARGDGLLVSGGTSANFVGVVAARAARTQGNIRKEGVSHEHGRLVLYASADTHTWIQKAADLFGLGTDAIRWVATDTHRRMDVADLRRQVEADRHLGHQPFLVVATAGCVSTGAVDPLPQVAALCREFGLWFHVDGAYGALAAQVPGAPADLRGLAEADSVAVDPHKWLYAPLEAGCVLVRDPDVLRKAFSYRPEYYQFDDHVVNYYERGPQNSRGFRALKVWLALRQAGRNGYLRMIEDDILLSRHLHQLLGQHAEFETMTQELSISTFRYVPTDLRGELGFEPAERYLDELNQTLLASVTKSGEAFLSNAVVNHRFALRSCIVNFHTSLGDVEGLPRLLSRLGHAADVALRGGRSVPFVSNDDSGQTARVPGGASAQGKGTTHD